MSTNVNMCAISGNLTRDSEIRTTQGGTTILTFGVAVNERRKNPQTGEWEDRPSFIDCSCFGSRASSLAQYLTKGTKVFVQGHLHQSSWETQDGSRRSKVEVIVDELDFGSRPQGQQGQQQAPTYQQAPAYQQAPQQYAAPTQQYSAPTAPMPQAPAYQQPQQTFYPNQAPMQQYVPQVEQDDIPF